MASKPPVSYEDRFEPTDPHAKRLHRKQRLAAGLRLFGRFGFDEGVAGHITARDPLNSEHFWVNPFGMSFKQISVADLVLCNQDGEVVEGSGSINRAAFAIHAAVHDRRPDAMAAAHSHSKYSRALSTLDTTLLPLTQDSCAFFDTHSRFDDYTGVVLDPTEGKRIADALGNNKAVILSNHGLLTVGTSVESALWWYICFERSAEVQLLAMAAGTPLVIGDDIATFTWNEVGTELAGWFQFQPLWDWITEAEPDLFD